MRPQTARLNMSFQPNHTRMKLQSFVGSIGGDSGSMVSGSYAFGSTLKPKAATKMTPGPGSYNTSSKLMQKSSSAAGIGIGKRELHQK